MEGPAPAKDASTSSHNAAVSCTACNVPTKGQQPCLCQACNQDCLISIPYWQSVEDQHPFRGYLLLMLLDVHSRVPGLNEKFDASFVSGDERKGGTLLHVDIR